MSSLISWRSDFCSQDGKLFFAKAMVCQRREKIPVVADKTLFRVASLSKLFTAGSNAVVRAGLLDLDADVNQYLTNFR